MLLNIIPIPALKDNYIWLIIHVASTHCLIVDPGTAPPVINAICARGLNPIGILLTHHHLDHIGGVPDLLKNYNIPVYGPAKEALTQVTHPLAGGESLTITPMALSLQVLSIAGHTSGHLAYYGHNAVFCGDTLFTGGCGRVLEGTMQQMYTALQLIASLPPPTNVYCGHEYTRANLAFAAIVEPDNAQLQQRIIQTQQLRQHQLPTVPSSLALEKATNPFLRCDKRQVRLAAERHHGSALTQPEQVFKVLREWKNHFS